MKIEDDPQTKRCTACGEIKTAAEFGYQKGKRKSGLGLYSRCRDCRERIRLALRRSDPVARAKMIESSRRSGQSPQAKERRRAAQQRRRINGTKEWAVKKLHKAVNRGQVIKPSACERCGAEPPRHQLHGHHWHGDYKNRPLDVEWLCSLCHGAEHSRRGGMHGQPDTG